MISDSALGQADGFGPARRVAFALLVFLIGVSAAAGCQEATPSSTTPRDPSVVGVVRSLEFVGPATAVFTLDTGQHVQLDFDSADRLYGGGTPKVDELLLYGPDAGGPRYVALPPSGDTFRIFTNLVATDAGTITFEFGLRLHLAPNYREGDGPFEPNAPAIYDVNEKGEVTELE